MENKIIQIHSTEESRLLSRFRQDWRMLKRIAVFFLLFLLLAYIGLHVGVRVWYNRVWEEAYQFNPTAYTQFQDFWNTPIRFPKEWDREVWVSSKFNQELENLNRIQNEIEEGYYLGNGANQWKSRIQDRENPFTEQDWEELGTFLQKFEPYLKAGFELIPKLESEIQQTPPTELLLGYTDHDYYLKQLQFLMELQSLQLHHDGQFNEAFLKQLSILPLLVKSPLVQFYVYYYRNYEFKPYLSYLQSVSNNVWDKEILLNGLQTLNRWEPYLFRIKKEYSHLYLLFTSLRSSQVPIDFAQEIQAKTYCQKIKDRENPPMGIRKAASNLFDHWFVGTPIDKPMLLLELIRPLILTSDIEELYMWRTTITDGSRDLLTEQQVAVVYDGLRIFLAARLYWLENKKYPTSVADLVPQYFPTEIKNRETGAPYQWDDQGQLILDPPIPQ